MVPRSSKVWKQYQHTINQFGKPSAIMSLLVSTDNDNILTPSNMDIMYNIYRSIYSANNKTDIFDNILYKDVCLRAIPNPSSNCLSDFANIHGTIFKNEAMLWQNQDSLLNRMNNNPLSKLFVGGLEYNDNDIIIGGKMVNFIYELNSYHHPFKVNVKN